MSPTASADPATVAPPRPAADARAATAPAVPALSVRGLHKIYRRTVAVADISLEVGPGEVVGLLGPNGAGKTTTIKVLTGLVTATAGEARIFGVDVADPTARRRVGYLPELFRFHEWMTGTAVVELHARLAGIPAHERRERVDEVLALVGLGGRGGEKVRGYSKGMQQRLGLAQALVGRPDLVLLDEPTSALDPVGRRDVRDLIRRLRAEGTAVLLNSHLLTEVESVCDRVIIVNHGRVVRSGRMDDLAGGAAQLRLQLDRVDAGLAPLLAPHGRLRPTSPTEAVLEVADLDVAPAVAAAVVRGGYQLAALVPVRRSLEDIFVGLVDGGDR